MTNRLKTLEKKTHKKLNKHQRSYIPSKPLIHSKKYVSKADWF